MLLSRAELLEDGPRGEDLERRERGRLLAELFRHEEEVSRRHAELVELQPGGERRRRRSDREGRDQEGGEGKTHEDGKALSRVVVVLLDGFFCDKEVLLVRRRKGVGGLVRGSSVVVVGALAVGLGRLLGESRGVAHFELCGSVALA